MPTTSLFSQVGLDTLFSREMNVAYIFFLRQNRDLKILLQLDLSHNNLVSFRKNKKNPFHFPDEHLIIHFPIPLDLAGSRDL